MTQAELQDRLEEIDEDIMVLRYYLESSPREDLQEFCTRLINLLTESSNYLKFEVRNE